MTTAETTVVIVGDLDLRSTPLLRTRLAEVLEHPPRRLVFDLAGVGFADCAAGRLIAGTGRFLPAGGLPVVRHPAPVVRRLLEVTGLDARCELDPAD